MPPFDVEGGASAFDAEGGASGTGSADGVMGSTVVGVMVPAESSDQFGASSGRELAVLAFGPSFSRSRLQAGNELEPLGGFEVSMDSQLLALGSRSPQPCNQFEAGILCQVPMNPELAPTRSGRLLRRSHVFLGGQRDLVVATMHPASVMSNQATPLALVHPP